MGTELLVLICPALKCRVLITWFKNYRTYKNDTGNNIQLIRTNEQANDPVGIDLPTGSRTGISVKLVANEYISLSFLAF